MSIVLYLEDTSDQQHLVAMVLRSIGLEVDLASDGQEGLKKISQRRPDLILLDLGMPRVDGFDFMTVVKAREETQDIPIVVISAWTANMHREKAAEAGAIAFISKPYELDDLITTIQQHLPA